MKRVSNRWRRRLVLFGIGLLFAGWWWLGTPRYEGRSVACWFEEFSQTATVQRQPRGRHVQRAIQGFGTNAVPYLLDQAFAEDWALRLWERAVTTVAGLNALAPEEFKEYLRTRADRQSTMSLAAVVWLRYLRPPGPLLLPTLTNHLESSHQQARFNALLMLGCLDATALPYLRPAFTNQAREVRRVAFSALLGLGTNAAGAVPDLIGALDESGLDRTVLLRNLFQIGAAARPALPQLRQLWHDETNFHALAAIIQIADEPWARDAFCQSLHQRTDRQLRLEALHYLESDTNFRLDVPDEPPAHMGEMLWPELLEAAKDGEAEVRYHALAAIGRLNLDTTALRPWLEGKLREPLPVKDNTSASWNEWHERLWAGDLLLRCDPTNAIALAFLADRLNDFQAWQAMDILARLEAPSPAALAVLEQATRHRDQSVRDLAMEALGEFR
ncbi:MAG TPA: hypothetical protein VMB21_03525 [Candidatus Limnocylindria bacterium]|jgi:HEAT repeat protein|nr:hypothetical protein [Candidatus Limnocylindria bacterium]